MNNDLMETLKKLWVPVLLGALVPISWLILFSWLVPEPGEIRIAAKVSFWFKACVFPSILGGAVIALLASQKIAETSFATFLKPIALTLCLALPTIALLCGLANGASIFNEEAQAAETTHPEKETFQAQGPEIEIEGNWINWTPGTTRCPGKTGYGACTIFPPNYDDETPITFTGIEETLHLVSGQKHPRPPSMETEESDVVNPAKELLGTYLVELPVTGSGTHSTFMWNPGNEHVWVMYPLTPNDNVIAISYEQKKFSNKITSLNGKDDASFEVPAGDWKYMWLIPLRSEDEMAKFKGMKIWPEGLSHEELAIVDPEGAKQLQINATHLDLPLFGTYFQKEGTKSVTLLEQPVTWKRNDVQPGQKIHLGINIPDGTVLEEPAHVIVGFSW